ncbi:hypothetical protein ACQ7C1_18410 [Rhizobium sp. Nf11,1]
MALLIDGDNALPKIVIGLSTVQSPGKFPVRGLMKPLEVFARRDRNDKENATHTKRRYRHG